jgi:hypothetical protein
MLDPVQQETDKCDSFPYSVEAVDQKPSVLPICICSRCSAMDTERTKPAKFERYNKIDMKTVTNLSAHQYFLCTRSVWAFILGIRSWSRCLDEKSLAYTNLLQRSYILTVSASRSGIPAL